MHKQRIDIAFSPCPNDTFIFDALVNNKIDTGNLQFEAVLEDVETLNEYALQQKFAVTKLSFGVLPAVLDKYVLLNAGAALGEGAGPLLVAQKETAAEDVSKQLIAIPGENTTAHLLFSLAYPAANNKIFMRYDRIEEFVLAGKGLGVIIHENRFTYAEKGLVKLADLSDVWQKKTGLPVPLGGIVARKTMQQTTIAQIDALIKQSIEYAYAHNDLLPEFITANAQEMSEAVMRKHIDLYVNNYSLDLGEKGKQAVSTIIDVWKEVHREKSNTL